MGGGLYLIVDPDLSICRIQLPSAPPFRVALLGPRYDYLIGPEGLGQWGGDGADGEGGCLPGEAAWTWRSLSLEGS